MSRKFNFMPSRYVTPRHGDESRGERDATVTSTGVPRDNQGTDRIRPQGQARDRPLTDAEREARAEHSHQEFVHKRLMKGLGEIRIAGRHSSKPLTADVLAIFFKEFGVPEDQGRAAYAAGQQDRARGVRCMCTACNGQRIYEDSKGDPH